MIKQRLKSKTYWLAMAVGFLPVLEQNLPMMQGYIGQYYSAVMFVIAMLIAMLREVTTKPLADK